MNAIKNLESIGKDHHFSPGVGEGTLSDIVNLSAVELSYAIKDKVVSCVDVMKSYLAQIDKVNPMFNAIVSLRNRDELLSEAAQKDSERARGIYHGWMHGFPHAVKDLAATKGIPTTMGSPLLANDITKHDAIFVERLRKAGAIIIGKTNTPEFGLGSQTYNNVFGTTYNASDVYNASADRSEWYETISNLFFQYDYLVLLIGPATQDLKVLQLANAYEQVSEWTKKVPPIVTG